MNDQGSVIGTAGPHPAALSLSRGSMLLLASCGAVTTATYLGAEWLRAPILAIPTGIWLVGIVQAAAYAVWQRQDARATTTTLPSATPRPMAVTATALPAPPALTLTPASLVNTEVLPARRSLLALDLLPPMGRIAAAVCDVAKSAAVGLQVSPDRIAKLENDLGAHFDRQPIVRRPLRVGLDVETELARILAAAPLAPGAPIEWIPMTAGIEDGADLRRHRLDAIVRRRDTGLRIATLEHEGRDAAWYDWSSQRPLSYASVFPLRIDPAQISLIDVEAGDLEQAVLIAQVSQLAAALSRSPRRLTLADRLFGRRAMAGLPPAGGDPRSVPAAADECMRFLAEQVTMWTSTESCSVRRAAARAASAWVATTEAWLDIAFRRRVVEAAAAMLQNEPELQLRLAAIRFASGDDQAGYHALCRADHLIREQGHEQIVDHLAFLEAELDLGTPGPMTLGRVAAGICLVCASSAAERIAYIRGDLMDDIRYSSWLVGRDQDRAVLMGVFRVLEQARGMGGEDTRQAA
jgi:hypothetical protein